MLVMVPRLTSSLRESFDVDQAYLQRKLILSNHKPRQSSTSVDESELARKIVHRWDEASYEVRQAYKQFIGAVVELVDGEVHPEEFREVALAVYRLFGTPEEEDYAEANITGKKQEMKMHLGHTVSDANMLKVASLAQRLSGMQSSDHGITLVSERPVNGTHDNAEFGADLVFHPPARFLVDVSLDDGESFCEESTGPSSYYEGSYGHSGLIGRHSATDGRGIDLSWLQDACDQITKSTTQLSLDELAMAICRVLDSDKPGDEIAGDLLDLVGDSAFETVQDLISHQKELVDAIHHGFLVMKSDKSSSSSQPRMPSYGTQVTVQTESERQIDKLRRKEEKRNRRGTEYGTDSDLAAVNFSSLLQASERKNLFDDLSGLGEGLAVNALPQGTQRKHHKGYEEVLIPPTPGAQMKPGEKLDLQLFPRIEVKLKILWKDGGKSCSLNIRLVKTNFRKYKSRAFIPHFPKVKNEAWWLVLGNTSTLELYALKRVSFSDHLVTNMELPSDSTTLQGMKLILISDCYLGLEQEHSISELNGWQQPK